MPVLASQRPMTRPSWTSQAARYCNAPPRSYSASTRRRRPGAGPRVAWRRMRAWMLVFSSELMIRSKGSARFPCQKPSYRSRTTAAFSKKSAARGKIQCSYCQGLMASSSRIRQTVLRLMGLFSSSRARPARSVVDWRLNGSPVRATTSQAIEATTALSRGGKDRLTATAGIVLEGELTSGPALPPAADGIGMEVETSGGSHVGERWGFVEEQDQSCTLPQMRRRGSSVEEASSLGEEL